LEALALALKKKPWLEAKAKTFLKLEKSPEHFQIKDLQFLANVNYAIAVPTQPFKSFGNFSSPFGTLAIR